MGSISEMPPGSVVAGRYELVRVLGRGGSSIVYEALDQLHAQRVALKVLGDDPDLDAARERLFREARLLESLEHEGIVRVVDVGPLARDRAFLVMEYLRGQTLAQRMDETFWLPLEEASALALEVLSAVDAAHAVGVVHRDLKPSNVFLCGGAASASVKLIDFGIGRILDDPMSRVTADDVVVGTVGYMAPEQLFGDDPTRASDVYAIGATLYEVLSGRPPHRITQGDIRGVLRAMSTDPAPLRELRPALPEALASGVMRALSRSPRERFGTCAEMAEACELAAPIAA